MEKKCVKEFLAWAIPCIKYYDFYTGSKREQIKQKWLEVGNETEKALETGVINDEVLKKGWCMAYPRVLKLIEKSVKNPMKEYMFNTHNELVIKWCSVREDANFCLALVGRVIKNYNNKLLVNILGKEKEVINNCKARKGDCVGIHYWEAVETLSREEFNKYSELIKEYHEYI